MKRYIPAFVAAVMMLGAQGCGSAGSGHEHEHGHGHGHEHGEEGGELSEVELSEAQMQAVGIEIGSVEQRAVGRGLNATGLLEVAPQDEAVAAPLLPGIVKRICVREGDRVARGAVIAYVESAELPGMVLDYQMALQEEASARREFERQSALAGQGAGVRKNLDAARSALQSAELAVKSAAARLRQVGVSESQAKAGEASVPVKAPVGGTVVKVDGATGMFADMQTPIARIVNTAGLYCRLGVVEKDIPALKAGQTVEMKLTNNPEVTFSGKVAEIVSTIDAATRKAAVRVSIDASGPCSGVLMPGMAVSALISTDSNMADALPEGAVVTAGGRSFVFMLEGEEMENGVKMYHFAKREVVAGATALGFTEITPVEPFPAGAKVVTSGAFYLNSMASDHGEHNH